MQRHNCRLNPCSRGYYPFNTPQTDRAILALRLPDNVRRIQRAQDIVPNVIRSENVDRISQTQRHLDLVSGTISGRPNLESG